MAGLAAVQATLSLLQGQPGLAKLHWLRGVVRGTCFWSWMMEWRGRVRGNAEYRRGESQGLAARIR